MSEENDASEAAGFKAEVVSDGFTVSRCCQQYVVEMRLIPSVCHPSGPGHRPQVLRRRFEDPQRDVQPPPRVAAPQRMGM